MPKTPETITGSADICYWQKWQHPLSALPQLLAALPQSRNRLKYNDTCLAALTVGRAGCSILCDAELRLLGSLKTLVSWAKTTILHLISPRCDPCKKIGENSLGMLRLAAARVASKGPSVATRRARKTGSARWVGPGRKLLVGLLVASAWLIPVTSSAGEGWTTMASSWDDAEGAKIAAIVPRVSSSGWTAGGSFDERSKPSSLKPNIKRWVRPEAGSKLVGLRSLITLAESHARGYDAIHHSAKQLPPRKPTELSIGEIFAWIDATKGQHHAIGFYQIIPSTLKRLVAKAGLHPNERFTPVLQDMLGDILIAEAGYRDFVGGRKPASKFMDDLAKIWAGFPMANGRSAYHDYAGNRASITRPFFEAELARIFGAPQRAAEGR